MIYNRFDRQERLFGSDGQKRLSRAHVGIVGVGGLGSHLAQQLAHLGIGQLMFIDDDIVERSNLNRLIGSRPSDAVSSNQKVHVMKRLVAEIDPGIALQTIPVQLRTQESLKAILQCDYVFGCVDNDGARLVLTELCAAYEIPYIDVASEVFVDDKISYGGRVFVNHDDKGCLYCYDEISTSDAQQDLENTETRRNREAVYGVNRIDLGDSGPSVVTVNAVVASLAATELLVMLTGLRQPSRLLKYYGHWGGRVCVNDDSPKVEDCYYCKSVRGLKHKANIDRYVLSLPTDKKKGCSR